MQHIASYQVKIETQSSEIALQPLHKRVDFICALRQWLDFQNFQTVKHVGKKIQHDYYSCKLSVGVNNLFSESNGPDWDKYKYL